MLGKTGMYSSRHGYLLLFDCSGSRVETIEWKQGAYFIMFVHSATFSSCTFLTSTHNGECWERQKCIPAGMATYGCLIVLGLMSGPSNKSKEHTPSCLYTLKPFQVVPSWGPHILVNVGKDKNVFQLHGYLLLFDCSGSRVGTIE